MKSMKYFGFLLIVIVLLISGVYAAQDVEVNNVLLKLSLHQGETSDKIVSISSKVGGTFNLEFTGVSGVSVAKSSFSLAAGESKDVTVHFDARSLQSGIFIGVMNVRSEHESTVIPIILEVESQDTLFDVNLDIPPQYKQITAKDKLVAQVKFFDLTSGGTSSGLGPTRIDTDYYIYDSQGKIVSSQSENLVVDRQSQITKTFSFPPDLAPGDYVLGVSARYHSSLGIATTMFSITSPKSSLFSFDLGGSLTIYFIIGLFVFVLVFLLLFVYIVRDRDKLIIEMRKYHSLEVNQLHRFLLAQEHVLTSRKSHSGASVKREVNEKIALLRRKHAEQERTLEKLRDDGNIGAMRSKIEEWKHQGYNTTLLEYRLKGLSVDEMKSLLHQWKKKYHGEGYKNGSR